MKEAEVSISLGSNIDRERNLRLAVAALRDQFGELLISPVYETAAVGFEGDDFYNLVVLLHSELPVREVCTHLKAIEDRIGRDRSQPKFSARSIDLDLLTYDDLVMYETGVQIPRHEILKNSFVLKPMADIMPRHRHPVEGSTYADLWAAMAPGAGRIDVVELALD